MADPRNVAVARAYLSPQEAAEYVGISERQMRDLVYRRVVPFTKVGRLLRFRVSELDAWLESNTTRPKAAS